MKQLITTLLSVFLLGTGCATQSQDFSKVYSKADPAVVVIMTTEKTPTLTDRGIKQAKGKGLGSGVIIDPDGLILTAAHVVDTADAIEVELHDERRRKAQVIASVGAGDLALIRLLDPPDELPHLPMGNSDDVSIGEQVIVIGAPYGLQSTLTVGYLSGRRLMPDTPFGDIEFLQTDAAINQGNSGGPMLNRRGEVIGIVSHISSQSGGNEGLGFAASSNMAQEMLLEQPPVWLGADIVMLSEDMAAALNAGQKSGMLVQKVATGSMADRLGIKPGYIPAEVGGVEVMLGGDIITSVNGIEVQGSKSGLTRLFRDYRRVQPGDKLTIEILRRGAPVELSATVE
jgi:serine protease Do